MSPTKANEGHIFCVIIVERQLTDTVTFRDVAHLLHVTKVGKSMFVTVMVVID
jgi:hypothetical protein